MRVRVLPRALCITIFVVGTVGRSIVLQYPIPLNVSCGRWFAWDVTQPLSGIGHEKLRPGTENLQRPEAPRYA